MKRILAIATILAISTTFLVGCGSSDDEILDPNYDSNMPLEDKIDKDFNDMFDDNADNYDMSKSYQDGLYKAEMSDFDGGYKDYVEITIKDNKIIDVVFDGKNETGQFKTDDIDLKTKFESEFGTYDYAKKYSEDLIDNQDISMISDIPGAEDQSEIFMKLVNSALTNAKNGNTETAIVTK